MMKEERVLTIVIINWNTREYLLACLDSIEFATKGFTVETIVVDNGSQDGSQDIVKKNYPWVSLIENKKNFGFAKAANDALRQMKGRYALLLNPDTQVKEGAIASLISFMDQHPEAGIIGAHLLNADGSKQNSISNFPSLTTELLNKSLLRWLFPKKFPGKERDYPEPIEVDSVIGACMMVRRDVLNQVGLLDEDYFLFLEETDWCYRMKKAGLKIYFIPQAEIYHFQGKSAETVKKRAKVEFYRSRYHFFRKNRGSLQWFILLIGLVIKLVVELVFAGVACLSTLFSVKKWRQRLSTYAYLLWWHLRFCPKGMGLGWNSP
jgi:GT2 family glycosyltransferase